MKSKTTTITKEYDEEGNLVKETETTYEYESPGPYINVACTCSWGYNYSCPVHGYNKIWINGGLTKTSDTFTINTTGSSTNRMQITS